MRSRCIFCCRYRSFQNVRVNHTAAENFYPAGVFAEVATFATTDVAGDVHFSRWLCEWEVGWTKTDFNVWTEHTLCKVEQCLLHICKRYVLCDVKTFNLMEDAVRAGSDGLVAEYAAWTNHADRRLLFLHSTNLQRGGVRTQ